MQFLTSLKSSSGFFPSVCCATNGKLVNSSLEVESIWGVVNLGFSRAWIPWSTYQISCPNEWSIHHGRHISARFRSREPCCYFVRCREYLTEANRLHDYRTTNECLYRSSSGKGPGNEMIVVTIIAAIDRRVDLPKVTTGEELREALNILGSVGTEEVSPCTFLPSQHYETDFCHSEWIYSSTQSKCPMEWYAIKLETHSVFVLCRCLLARCFGFQRTKMTITQKMTSFKTILPSTTCRRTLSSNLLPKLGLLSVIDKPIVQLLCWLVGVHTTGLRLLTSDVWKTSHKLQEAYSFRIEKEDWYPKP